MSEKAKMVMASCEDDPNELIASLVRQLPQFGIHAVRANFLNIHVIVLSDEPITVEEAEAFAANQMGLDGP